MILPLLCCCGAYGKRLQLVNALISRHIHPYAFVFPRSTTRPTSLAPASAILFAKNTNTKMRGVKKENLPSKICVVCNRPFTWRKKWERCWDEITTCSKSCNSKRRGRKTEAAPEEASKDDAVRTSSKANSRNSIKTDNEKIKDVRSMLAMNSANLDIIRDTTTNDEDTDEMNDFELEEDFSSVRKDLQNLLELSDNEKASVSSHNNSPEIIEGDDCFPCGDPKARRKEEKKRMKAERRAQREGRGDPSTGQKQCTYCNKSVDLLIRCTYDSSEEWGMVCGKCWKDVSGGVVDGDDAHPFYRYGGLWKNRRAQKQK